MSILIEIDLGQLKKIGVAFPTSHVSIRPLIALYLIDVLEIGSLVGRNDLLQLRGVSPSDMAYN